MALIMEYKRNRAWVFGLCLLVFMLSGCETHLSPDDLKIIGEPHKFPDDALYYGTEFAYQFGVSGGDGTYHYEYIQNPKDEDGKDYEDFNHVVLTIDQTDSAKPSFWLRGTPQVKAGEDFDQQRTFTLHYQLKVISGGQSKTEDYEFKLEKNKISITEGSLKVTEGQAFNRTANSMISLRQNGNTLVCKSGTDRLYEKTTLSNGVTVYPAAFMVQLTKPSQSRVELFYQFSSNYNPDLPERAANNIGLARPGVDYLNEERSVVFEPGETNCLIYLNVLDDALIEGEETVKVSFSKRQSGLVDFDGIQTEIVLVDDEPVPTYTPQTVTKSEGGNVVGNFILSKSHKYPLSINVSVDSSKSTANGEDYRLIPENGVVTIKAGETAAFYTVSLLNNDDGVYGTADDVISVVTDIDKIIDADPLQITVNEWPKNGSLDLEVVASSSAHEKAVDMAVDADGVVAVLVESTENVAEEAVSVKGFNRDGTPFNLTGTGPIKLSKAGMGIKPKAIASTLIGGKLTLAVVAEVNGQFADVHRGGADFILALYQRSSQQAYQLVSVKQYGTEGDDFIHGVLFTDRANLYVYGKTTGQEFDSSPGAETNSGGEDGFVYQYSLQTTTQSQWQRLIGSADQDAVVSLDAGRQDLVALTHRRSTDLDAFVRSLTVNSGADQDQAVDASIASARDDNVTTVRFDDKGSSYRVLLDSNSVFPSGSATSSLSKDVSLLVYDASGEFEGSVLVATDQDDFAVDLEQLEKEGALVAAGHTEGRFANNDKKGTTGSDAFVSILSSNDSPIPSIERTLQFGTAGIDKVIDIEEVGERKFMVLWSENSTEGNGATRYRISAFSPEGEKLSPDP